MYLFINCCCCFLQEGIQQQRTLSTTFFPDIRPTAQLDTNETMTCGVIPITNFRVEWR